MAIRKTAYSDVLEKFDKLNFTHDDSGAVMVTTDYLPERIRLEDTLDMVDDQHFRLAGRVSDQINIAGKRGSLHEVNNVLLAFPGLIDGVVFFPPQDKTVPRLVAMVVLPEGATAKELQAHFRQYLDAAFVPRPIIQVDKLPREDNGKLIKKRLLEFYKSTLQRKT